MVWLMDRLLKLENLDLCLTPYKVLATGHDEGMLEFIPSRSLAQVRSAAPSGHCNFESKQSRYSKIGAFCMFRFSQSTEA